MSDPATTDAYEHPLPLRGGWMVGPSKAAREPDALETRSPLRDGACAAKWAMARLVIILVLWITGLVGPVAAFKLPIVNGYAIELSSVDHSLLLFMVHNMDDRLIRQAWAVGPDLLGDPDEARLRRMCAGGNFGLWTDRSPWRVFWDYRCILAVPCWFLALLTLVRPTAYLYRRFGARQEGGPC